VTDLDGKGEIKKNFGKKGRESTNTEIFKQKRASYWIGEFIRRLTEACVKADRGDSQMESHPNAG